MTSHKIGVNKTAHIATLGNPRQAKYVILALHGYGQLVPYFLRKFQGLETELVYVVAPEGLHRFYLTGTSGRVGASWMTKEQRSDDISDNLLYLDRVFQEFIEPLKFDKFIVLGFSQGAATAARWIDRSSQQVDAFIQWAGVFPPDLPMGVSSSIFHTLQHYFVVGNQDPYFEHFDHHQAHESFFLENGLRPKYFSFDGAHQLDLACLQEILNDIKSS